MSVEKKMSDLWDAITRATEGLLFHSESDAPIEPYRWTEHAVPSKAALLKAEGRRPDEVVEELTLHELFDPVTQEQSFWNEEDRAEAARYKALVELLEEGLSEVRVYRVGKVDIDVYVVGKHPSGGCAGVKTHVVET
jgi:hypothetical protein